MTLGSASLAAAAVMAAEPGSGSADRSMIDTCADMMGNAGSAEGGHAMQEFMRSDRVPQAMTSMMAMVRRMGNGDAMLGMTRMMEMMGRMGGTTEGSGGGMEGMMGGSGASPDRR
jgi:hypothetical protein